MESIRQSLNRTSGRIAELLLLVSIPLVVIGSGWQLVGDDDLSRQLVVWAANFLMILAIWPGLRLRGQTLLHFGVGCGFAGWAAIFSVVWRALVVQLYLAPAASTT